MPGPNRRINMHTISTAVHVSHLDAMTGYGVLVRPLLSGDIASPVMGPSLHAADWDAMIRHLGRLGWEPIEDDEVDDLPLCVGVTADGCEVVALHGREPILDDPDPEQLAEAEDVLRGLAGMW